MKYIMIFVFIFSFGNTNNLTDINVKLNTKLNNIKLQMIHYKKFDVLYSKQYKIPIVTYCILTKSEIIAKNHKRYNHFFYDKNIDKKYQANPYSTYRKTSYDKGHMVSNDDFNYNKEYQKETFYMTNITPQTPYFNRVIWKRYEIFERGLARRYNKSEVVNIVCGIQGKIRNDVAVPKAIAKIIFVPSLNKTYYIFVPNKRKFIHKKFSDYFVSKNVLEKRCNVIVKIKN